MRKIITCMILGLLSLVSCTEYDEVAMWNKNEDMGSRLAALEELCSQLNTNIVSLQQIVEALQGNDYVTGVVPVVENGETVGYTISFSKSGPVTIYHGKKGENGQNGTTPVIGVEQDTDGLYYWTLDGEWLTDDEGSKILAQGMAGKSAYELAVEKDTGERSTNGWLRSTAAMATTVSRLMSLRWRTVIRGPRRSGWPRSRAVPAIRAMTASRRNWRSATTVIGIFPTTTAKRGINWARLRAIPVRTAIRCSAT